jgi:hypothetical protein
MLNQVSPIPTLPHTKSNKSGKKMTKDKYIERSDFNMSDLSSSSFNAASHRGITLPLQNLHRTTETLDILKEDLAQRKCEHLFCLEFDLRPTLPLPCDFNSDLYGEDILKD